MRRSLIASVIALAGGVMASLAVGAPGAAPAGRFVITDLGTLGGSVSNAVAINARGEVIGWSFTATEGSHGFLWRSGQMVDLGPGEAVAMNDKGRVVVVRSFAGRSWSRVWAGGRSRALPPLSGWRDSEAIAINDRGQIVGSSGKKPYGSDDVGVHHAVMWQDGRITDLGTLGGTSSEATAINERGEIAGWSETKTGRTHAFLWRHGKMTDLGVNVSGWTVALNDRGLVVADRVTRSLSRRAFLWRDGRIRDLGTLGGAQSEVAAINNRGQTIGRSQVRRNLYHAFLWQNGTMSDLRTRWATAINDRTQIVGATGTKSGKTHAYLWQDDRLIDLGALGGAANHSEATGINDHGQIIGNSEDHAVLWTWRPAK